MNRNEIEQRTILIALTGSRGYGLQTESSDYDYRGVFIATKPYYYGFSKIEQRDRDWVEGEGLFSYLGKDTCIYELKKYLELSADNNPNILELLWYKDYMHLTPVGKALIDRKQMFLSKKVWKTYAGYGYAQIRKLESHRKWLLDPPQQKPQPEDFGLEPTQVMSKTEIHAFLEYLYLLIRDRVQFLEQVKEFHRLLTTDIDFKGVLRQYELPEDTLTYTQQLTHSSHDFIRLLQTNQQYLNACREYDNYQQWKKNRNPARAVMEAKVGYDCKFAMQAIRLLRTGIEILTHESIIVDRREAGDTEELLAIKRGDYSYSDVMAIANDLYAGLESAHSKSTLPNDVDRSAINQLCIDLVTLRSW
ncbi:DNA polymerase beta superfamily protein [Tumidithrix helvetica PCC 7403]|uniref:nucleotidyltransferase domain-containing protein n=1 Tax=Tumidithrix helvetica TaxID=3457545 RepID=UPI003CA6074A